jgi:hypothetical protein
MSDIRGHPPSPWLLRRLSRAGGGAAGKSEVSNQTSEFRGHPPSPGLLRKLSRAGGDAAGKPGGRVRRIQGLGTSQPSASNSKLQGRRSAAAWAPGILDARCWMPSAYVRLRRDEPCSKEVSRLRPEAAARQGNQRPENTLKMCSILLPVLMLMLVLRIATADGPWLPNG